MLKKLPFLLVRSSLIRSVCLVGRLYSVSKMPSVVVRSISEEQHLTLSFEYGGKQRRMKRLKLELLQKTLQRIVLSLNNKKKTKKIVAKDSDSSVINSEVKINLYNSGEEVDAQISNSEAWRDGCLLMIGDLEYVVEFNPPAVSVLTIPNSFMAGFPVFPVVEVEFADKHLCVFRWFKSVRQVEDEIKESASASVTEDTDSYQWQVVGNEFIYTPTVEEVGCHLKLECIPVSLKRKGHMRQVSSTVTVSAGPGSCPFDKRHLYTGRSLEGNGAFRVVSYNILADTYATGEFAEDVLYPYCPKYALNIQYRRQLLLKEIIGYNADIICLQECGRTAFRQILLPALEMLGFNGMLQCKLGEVPEGEAIFFRKSKFELVQQHNIIYAVALVEDPLHKMIFEKVASFKPLLYNLQRRGQVGQVSVLKTRDQPANYICVANTHLYYRPSSPHIRLIQSSILLNHVEQVVKQYISQGTRSGGQTDDVAKMKVQVSNECTDLQPSSSSCEGPSDNRIEVPRARQEIQISTNYETCEHMAVLFCGDFNSSPSSAVRQLFTEGHVETSHTDWTLCDDKEQHCTTLTLANSFNLSSTCDGLPFTNYTAGYKGTLDYIFCDANHLQVESVIPVPTENELAVHVALPSVVMPSDHLALVCDLAWKDHVSSHKTS